MNKQMQALIGIFVIMGLALLVAMTMISVSHHQTDEAIAASFQH